MRDRLTKASIALIIVGAACVTALASRRNSLTWDEPVMIASGARGVRTGDFSMTWDQPPGVPYLDGVAMGTAARAALAALVVASAASPLVRYPWFLSYITEWVPPRASRTAMVDSNVDWGQGLLALRDFMRDERVDGVYLGYFGSALPEGYGIRYSPPPSWSPLPLQPPLPEKPKWAVISVTLLQGLYENGDPFQVVRANAPDRIIANSLFVYRVP